MKLPRFTPTLICTNKQHIISPGSKIARQEHQKLVASREQLVTAKDPESLRKLDAKISIMGEAWNPRVTQSAIEKFLTTACYLSGVTSFQPTIHTKTK